MPSSGVQHTMNERQMLRASDVAADLGVSSGRVYQLISAGVIPSTRINRSVRIPRAAWDSWLRDRAERALSAVAPPVGPASGVSDTSPGAEDGRAG